MATDSLWQRTQIGYLPRQTATNSQPTDHQYPTMAMVRPSHLSSQLQFNMNVPTLSGNMATHFRKPQPIVIEKLEGPKQDSANSAFVPRIPENYPRAANSSLSSERIAFAVNLAKRDIKRAKLMPSLDDQAVSDEQPKERHSPRKRKPKREDKQPVETMRQRVQRSLRHRDKETQKSHDLYFYPAPQHTHDDNTSHQTQEIRKLRKELHTYMKQLDGLQQERPVVLRNRDNRMKKRKENRLSDDELDERQVVRAEEQAVRSSRMLYALQRQVQDLQDELNRKGRNVKHTKKSQTLHRLAAAHRAAVRALQTFISQTPLHSKASEGRPDMYQDLAILVRQLSLLSSQLQIGADDHPDDTMADRSTAEYHHGDHTQYKPSRSAFYKDVDENSFVQPTMATPPTKDKQQLQPMEEATTPNPSPERDAVLRAGLQALVRAREEALNAEKVKPKGNVLSRPTDALTTRKSVLLPAQLKAKRQRMQPTGQRIKPPDIKQAGFTKDTVSSTLRKVDKDDPDNHPPKSPPRTPIKCPQRGTPIKRHGSPERLCEEIKVSPPPCQASPRSPRRSLEDEFKNPRRPKYQRQMLPEQKDLLEREIARQVWLDREAELRMKELEDELSRKRHHPDFASDGVRLARQILHETEEAIVHRLQPLLDRAEAIMEANKKQEEEKKRSLKQQLTDLATRTTMKQGHVLAEQILEDILDDTVLELQRLEMEDEAEMVVSGIQNRSSIESVMQRLQSFEKCENDIRRHWARVEYEDVDHPTRTEEPSEPTQQAAPMTFTKDQPVKNDKYLDRKVKQLNTRIRVRDDKKRFRLEPGDLSSESGSTESLLEGVSTARSDVTSHREPSLRQPLTRPKIALFVPSELRTSIASYRSKYERFLRDTATHVQGSFNPWTLAEGISEDLLDEMIVDIATELGGVCDEYTENIFTKEFIPAVDNSCASIKQ